MHYIVDKQNKKVEEFFKSTKIELDKFFNFKVREPALFLLSSREQLDMIYEEKTQEWLVGCTKLLSSTKNGVIFILSPEVFSKQSSHKNPDEFWQVLKHEYCHIYFRQITGGVYPLWLNEGLANYLSGQKKSGGEPMDVFNYFNKAGNGVYQVGFFWVEFLIKKFGKRKIKQLIDNLKIDPVLTEKRFAEIFYGVYGFRFNQKGLKIILKQ